MEVEQKSHVPICGCLNGAGRGIKAQYFNSITGAQTSKDCRVHRIDVLSTRPKAFLNDSFTAFKSVNIYVRCVFEKRKKKYCKQIQC